MEKLLDYSYYPMFVHYTFYFREFSFYKTRYKNLNITILEKFKNFIPIKELLEVNLYTICTNTQDEIEEYFIRIPLFKDKWNIIIKHQPLSPSFWEKNLNLVENEINLILDNF